MHGICAGQLSSAVTQPELPKLHGASFSQQIVYARSSTDVPCETPCNVGLSPSTYDGYDQHVSGIDHSARLSERGRDHTDSEEAGLGHQVAQELSAVSNIPFFGEVTERVVAARLTCYLSERGLHDPICSQRTGRAAALRLPFCGSWMTLGGRLTAGRAPSGPLGSHIILDLSAAFDIIDHGILLARLEQMAGIRGTALQWLRSYFSDQVQSVSINGTRSTIVQLGIGVPQGSVLGPLLF